MKSYIVLNLVLFVVLFTIACCRRSHPEVNKIKCNRDLIIKACNDDDPLLDSNFTQSNNTDFICLSQKKVLESKYELDADLLPKNTVHRCKCAVTILNSTIYECNSTMSKPLKRFLRRLRLRDTKSKSEVRPLKMSRKVKRQPMFNSKNFITNMEENAIFDVVSEMNTTIIVKNPTSSILHLYRNPWQTVTTKSPDTKKYFVNGNIDPEVFSQILKEQPDTPEYLEHTTINWTALMIPTTTQAPWYLSFNNRKITINNINLPLNLSTLNDSESTTKTPEVTTIPSISWNTWYLYEITDAENKKQETITNPVTIPIQNFKNNKMWIDSKYLRPNIRKRRGVRHQKPTTKKSPKTTTVKTTTVKTAPVKTATVKTATVKTTTSTEKMDYKTVSLPSSSKINYYIRVMFNNSQTTESIEVGNPLDKNISLTPTSTTPKYYKFTPPPVINGLTVQPIPTILDFIYPNELKIDGFNEEPCKDESCDKLVYGQINNSLSQLFVSSTEETSTTTEMTTFEKSTENYGAISDVLNNLPTSTIPTTHNFLRDTINWTFLLGQTSTTAETKFWYSDEKKPETTTSILEQSLTINNEQHDIIAKRQARGLGKRFSQFFFRKATNKPVNKVYDNIKNNYDTTTKHITLPSFAIDISSKEVTTQHFENTDINSTQIYDNSTQIYDNSTDQNTTAKDFSEIFFPITLVSTTSINQTTQDYTNQTTTESFDKSTQFDTEETTIEDSTTTVVSSTTDDDNITTNILFDSFSSNFTMTDKQEIVTESLNTTDMLIITEYTHDINVSTLSTTETVSDNLTKVANFENSTIEAYTYLHESLPYVQWGRVILTTPKTENSVIDTFFNKIKNESTSLELDLTSTILKPTTTSEPNIEISLQSGIQDFIKESVKNVSPKVEELPLETKNSTNPTYIKDLQEFSNWSLLLNSVNVTEINGKFWFLPTETTTPPANKTEFPFLKNINISTWIENSIPPIEKSLNQDLLNNDLPITETPVAETLPTTTFDINAPFNTDLWEAAWPRKQRSFFRRKTKKLKNNNVKNGKNLKSSPLEDHKLNSLINGLFVPSSNSNVNIKSKSKCLDVTESNIPLTLDTNDFTTTVQTESATLNNSWFTVSTINTFDTMINSLPETTHNQLSDALDASFLFTTPATTSRNDWTMGNALKETTVDVLHQSIPSTRLEQLRKEFPIKITQEYFSGPEEVYNNPFTKTTIKVLKPNALIKLDASNLNNRNNEEKNYNSQEYTQSRIKPSLQLEVYQNYEELAKKLESSGLNSAIKKYRISPNYGRTTSTTPSLPNYFSQFEAKTMSLDEEFNESKTTGTSNVYKKSTENDMLKEVKTESIYNNNNNDTLVTNTSNKSEPIVLSPQSKPISMNLMNQSVVVSLNNSKLVSIYPFILSFPINKKILYELQKIYENITEEFSNNDTNIQIIPKKNRVSRDLSFLKKFLQDYKPPDPLKEDFGILKHKTNDNTMKNNFNITTRLLLDKVNQLFTNHSSRRRYKKSTDENFTNSQRISSHISPLGSMLESILQKNLTGKNNCDSKINNAFTLNIFIAKLLPANFKEKVVMDLKEVNAAPVTTESYPTYSIAKPFNQVMSPSWLNIFAQVAEKILGNHTTPLPTEYNVIPITTATTTTFSTTIAPTTATTTQTIFTSTNMFCKEEKIKISLPIERGFTQRSHRRNFKSGISRKYTGTTSVHQSKPTTKKITTKKPTTKITTTKIPATKITTTKIPATKITTIKIPTTKITTTKKPERKNISKPKPTKTSNPATVTKVEMLPNAIESTTKLSVLLIPDNNKSCSNCFSMFVPIHNLLINTQMIAPFVEGDMYAKFVGDKNNSNSSIEIQYKKTTTSTTPSTITTETPLVSRSSEEDETFIQTDPIILLPIVKKTTETPADYTTMEDIHIPDIYRYPDVFNTSSNEAIKASSPSFYKANDLTSSDRHLASSSHSGSSFNLEDMSEESDEDESEDSARSVSGFRQKSKTAFNSDDFSSNTFRRGVPRKLSIPHNVPFKFKMVKEKKADHREKTPTRSAKQLADSAFHVRSSNHYDSTTKVSFTTADTNDSFTTVSNTSLNDSTIDSEVEMKLLNRIKTIYDIYQKTLPTTTSTSTSPTTNTEYNPTEEEDMINSIPDWLTARYNDETTTFRDTQVEYSTSPRWATDTSFKSKPLVIKSFDGKNKPVRTFKIKRRHKRKNVPRNFIAPIKTRKTIPRNLVIWTLII